MIPCSPVEWHCVSTLLGKKCLPVLAEIANQWFQYQSEKREEDTVHNIHQQPCLLVISPHPDDAAVSVGGFLHVTARNWQRHILTLIGQSNYELNRGIDEFDIARVSARRKSEDKLFAEFIGATLHQGNALDAPLRDSSLSPFRVPEDAHIAEFETMIDNLVQDIHPSLILAPIGIGGHSDHIAAQRAATTVAQHQHINLLFYEDLPYAAESDEINSYIDGSIPNRVAWWLSIQQELLRKIACLSIYESQFDLAAIQRTITKYAWDGQTWIERFWSLDDSSVEAEIINLLRLISCPVKHP